MSNSMVGVTASNSPLLALIKIKQSDPAKN